ncbi:MAG: 4Fe-4S binding protein [Coriobacteriaceae bacterium]|jgi:ferredoxin|nr:4Fe-4S binding protein [Coriobacteriaceae bacterium]
MDYESKRFVSSVGDEGLKAEHSATTGVSTEDASQVYDFGLQLLQDATGGSYCNFCNLCIECCPTGALRPFDPDGEWIAPAVIDRSLCIAHQPEGVGCRRCIDGCPFEAITADASGRPVVAAEECNGCGYCEYICPSNSYRVFTGIRRGISVEAGNGARSAAAALGGGPS